MKILQIGELAKKLSPEFTDDTRGQIQWGLVKGMRNHIVHEYMEIDEATLWETITKDIPVLRRFCDEQ
jgi:uncharacterized protein with HEPN domain